MIDQEIVLVKNSTTITNKLIGVKRKIISEKINLVNWYMEKEFMPIIKQHNSFVVITEAIFAYVFFFYYILGATKWTVHTRILLCYSYKYVTEKKQVFNFLPINGIMCK